jgi:hypothetical protein
MASVGNDFVATWSMPHGDDQGNIYFRRLMLRGHDDDGSDSSEQEAAWAARGIVPSGPSLDAAAIAHVLSGSLPTPMAARLGRFAMPPVRRANLNVVLPSSSTTLAVHPAAADAVFAASHAATHDDAVWLSAPLVSNSLDAM